MAAGSSIKVLNVAEKNDAAKALSNIMSGGGARKVSLMVYNACSCCPNNLLFVYYNCSACTVTAF